jgi:hypothetical protein
MQHVHSFESPHGQKQSVTPLRVTVVQPSVWTRMKTKIEQTLSPETMAEVIFGSATVLLTAGMFIALARALAHYTIVPLP